MDNNPSGVRWIKLLYITDWQFYKNKIDKDKNKKKTRLLFLLWCLGQLKRFEGSGLWDEISFPGLTYRVSYLSYLLEHIVFVWKRVRFDAFSPIDHTKTPENADENGDCRKQFQKWRLVWSDENGDFWKRISVVGAWLTRTQRRCPITAIQLQKVVIGYL